MIFVFLFLTSLCIISSKSIHLIKTNSNAFLWLSNIPFGEGNGNPLQY